MKSGDEILANKSDILARHRAELLQKAARFEATKVGMTSTHPPSYGSRVMRAGVSSRVNGNENRYGNVWAGRSSELAKRAEKDEGPWSRGLRKHEPVALGPFAGLPDTLEGRPQWKS